MFNKYLIKDSNMSNQTKKRMEIIAICILRGGGIMVGTARNYVWNWKSSPYNGDVVEYQIIP